MKNRTATLAMAILFLISTREHALGFTCPPGTSEQQEVDRQKMEKLIYCGKRGEMMNGPMQQYSVENNGALDLLSKGRLVMEATVVDGKLEGPAKKFYPNGALQTEFQFKRGEIDGAAKDYYPTASPKGALMVEYENRGGAMNGGFKKFYESGKVRSQGEMTNGNPSGSWKFWAEDGKLLAEGAYEEVSESIKKYDEAGKAARLLEQKTKDNERQRQVAARLAKVRKNWSAKSAGGIDTHFDAKNRLYWSGWLGLANFHTAKAKCKNLGSGWHLPSKNEWGSSLSAGMLDAIPEMGQAWWSSTDQASETDPSSSMILGEKNAWAINGVVGEMAPFDKIKDQIGVRCVRK